MKTICESGFKISSVDRKALDHYLVITPKEWATNALAGMINKAIKIIIRDWIEIYKSKQEDVISGDLAILIPAIIAMEEFVNYNIPIPKLEGQIQREDEPTKEIWNSGFDIEDYEEAALRAYYKDPEGMLRYFMENKIYQRRKRFVEDNQKEFIKRKDIIPVKQDDFINVVCRTPGYKNRAQRESESI